MNEPDTKKTLGEWLQGWVAPSILIGLFVMLVGWGVRVEVHMSNTDLHHSAQSLKGEYVQCAVDTEREKRIDEKLAEIGKSLDNIDRMLRENERPAK